MNLAGALVLGLMIGVPSTARVEEIESPSERCGARQDGTMVAGTRTPPGAATEGSVARRLAILPRPDPGDRLRAKVGEAFQLQAELECAGGARQGANDAVIWASSDPAVLRVSNGGNGGPAGYAVPLRAGVVSVFVTYPHVGRTASGGLHPPLGDAVTVLIAPGR
jgi:hypothetical protein